MESFMKEGSGGDDLSIGVKLPNGETELPMWKNLYLVPGIVSFILSAMDFIFSVYPCKLNSPQ